MCLFIAYGHGHHYSSWHVPVVGDKTKDNFWMHIWLLFVYISPLLFNWKFFCSSQQASDFVIIYRNCPKIECTPQIKPSHTINHTICLCVRTGPIWCGKFVLKTKWHTWWWIFWWTTCTKNVLGHMGNLIKNPCPPTDRWLSFFIWRSRLHFYHG